MYEKIIGADTDYRRMFGRNPTEERVNSHIHEVSAERPMNLNKVSESIRNPNYSDLFGTRPQDDDQR
jgi:hypothetical protein